MIYPINSAILSIMNLQSPFIISARLLPAIVIDNVTISFDQKNNVFYFDGPDFEYVENSFRPGAGSDIQDCFVAILDFLGAFAEAISYETRTGRESDNKTLFPSIMSDWAIKNSDEFSILQQEIDEFELITD